MCISFQDILPSVELTSCEWTGSRAAKEDQAAAQVPHRQKDASQEGQHGDS